MSYEELVEQAPKGYMSYEELVEQGSVGDEVDRGTIDSDSKRFKVESGMQWLEDSVAGIGGDIRDAWEHYSTTDVAEFWKQYVPYPEEDPNTENISPDFRRGNELKQAANQIASAVGSGMEGVGNTYDEVVDLVSGPPEMFGSNVAANATATAPVGDQVGDQVGDPVEVYPPVKNPMTWSPDRGWLGAKTTGDRPPLAGAGRLDVTAMDKFMDKIEEMQRGRRGMALIAMAAEMGKRHKGGFLPSAVAGMNAAGQSARGTDKLAMEGYGLAATLEQRGQDAELNYQGRLAQARRSAANRASDNEDRKNARKQATFDDQWIALLKNENSHMLESIMRPIYESEFGKTEAAVQALESLKARFYGGSLGINKGEITVSDQIEARGVVMRALAEQIRSQQMFAGDSGGGDQRYVPLNDFLQRRDV